MLRAEPTELTEPVDIVWDERLQAEISLYGRDRGTRERRRKGNVIEVGWRSGRHAADALGPQDVAHARARDDRTAAPWLACLQAHGLPPRGSSKCLTSAPCKRGALTNQLGIEGLHSRRF